jgi:hypothetical protein
MHSINPSPRLSGYVCAHNSAMPSFDFSSAPGHLIRRAHQTSIALFAQEMAAANPAGHTGCRPNYRGANRGAGRRHLRLRHRPPGSPRLAAPRGRRRRQTPQTAMANRRGPQSRQPNETAGAESAGSSSCAFDGGGAIAAGGVVAED